MSDLNPVHDETDQSERDVADDALQDVLTTVAANLAAVDVAPELAQLETITARQERIAAALRTGRARLADVRTMITERERSGPDGRAAAAALLTGDSAPFAPRSLAALEDEATDLRAGIDELASQASDARDAPFATQIAIRAKLAPSVAEFTEHLAVEAAELSAELCRIYATAVAASAATRSGPMAGLVQRLVTPIAHLAASRMVTVDDFVVPDEVRHALSVNPVALRAANCTVPATVHPPQVDRDGYAAGFADGRAAATRAA